MAKLFVPLIKGSVFPQFYAIFGKLNFWRNIDRCGPYKNGENLNYLKLSKEIIFWQNYLFHSSKEEFLHNFRQFLENWIFEGILTGADLTKMLKICIILICAKKILFGKIICSIHQRKCFSTILRNFWKIEFWRNIDRRTPYKMLKIWTISICAKKIFFGKIICSTHQRKCFSTILRNFWKIEFLKEYRQARSLIKMVNIWTILNCAKKIFFVKIICSTHQRKCFSTTLRNFWKIEFLKEYRQARTLQKWWKFVLS